MVITYVVLMFNAVTSCCRKVYVSSVTSEETTKDEQTYPAEIWFPLENITKNDNLNIINVAETSTNRRIEGKSSTTSTTQHSIAVVGIGSSKIANEWWISLETKMMLTWRPLGCGPLYNHFLNHVASWKIPISGSSSKYHNSLLLDFSKNWH